MKCLDALLTNQPVLWHPSLRVAALDAAFIWMCSHSVDALGEFDDVVVNDFGEYGVSVDVICIEKVDGIAQMHNFPHITPICIFEPTNLVMRREDVEPPAGLEDFNFFGQHAELVEFLADHELALDHARDMRNRFRVGSPIPGLCDLINIVEVFAAARGFDEGLNSSVKPLPASHG